MLCAYCCKINKGDIDTGPYQLAVVTGWSFGNVCIFNKNVTRPGNLKRFFSPAGLVKLFGHFVLPRMSNFAQASGIYNSSDWKRHSAMHAGFWGERWSGNCISPSSVSGTATNAVPGRLSTLAHTGWEPIQAGPAGWRNVNVGLRYTSKSHLSEQ